MLGAAGGFGDAAVLSPSNVWFASPSCQSGAICPLFHWNGSTWSTVQQPPRFVLTDLSGSSPRNVWAAGYVQAKAGAAQGLVAAYRWSNGAWSRVRLPRESGRAILADAASRSNVWIATVLTQRPRPLHWNGTQWRRLPRPPQPIPAGGPISAFGQSGLRIGAMGLWNGRTWLFGPDLASGFDIATIPGTTSAWMVGAWQAPKTGLTAEVRFSR